MPKYPKLTANEVYFLIHGKRFVDQNKSSWICECPGGGLIQHFDTKQCYLCKKKHWNTKDYKGNLEKKEKLSPQIFE